MNCILSVSNRISHVTLQIKLDVEVSFGRWICIALPFCFIGILISWVAILLIIKPDDLSSIPIVVYERKSILGKKNIAVIMLSLTVMTLFATSSFTESTFGDIGVISLCYVFVMFGSGMLTEVLYGEL